MSSVTECGGRAIKDGGRYRCCVIGSGFFKIGIVRVAIFMAVRGWDVKRMVGVEGGLWLGGRVLIKMGIGYKSFGEECTGSFGSHYGVEKVDEGRQYRGRNAVDV